MWQVVIATPLETAMISFCRVTKERNVCTSTTDQSPVLLFFSPAAATVALQLKNSGFVQAVCPTQRRCSELVTTGSRVDQSVVLLVSPQLGLESRRRRYQKIIIRYQVFCPVEDQKKAMSSQVEKPHSQTDSQTDRQTDRQADRQIVKL